MKNKVFFIVAIVVFYFVAFAGLKSDFDNHRPNEQGIEQKRINFEKNWSNFYNALDLFLAYTSNTNMSKFKYRQAAITLMKYYIEDPNKEKVSAKQMKFLLEEQRLLNEAIQKNPNNADLLALLGSIYLITDSKDKGLSYIEKASKINPETYTALFAYSNAMDGKHKKAYELYTTGLTYNPYDNEAWLLKAETCISLGKKDEAIQICKKLSTVKGYENDSTSLAYYCLKNKDASDSEIIQAIAPNDVNKPYQKTYAKLAKEMITNSSHVRHGNMMAQKAISINPIDISTYITITGAYMELANKTFLNKILAAS